jgi:hypothetical protein
MTANLTHQQGLNCAAKLAGDGLEPTLRLFKRTASAPQRAEVWLETYDLGIDDLVALRDRVLALGWRTTLSGGNLDVVGKASG